MQIDQINAIVKLVIYVLFARLFIPILQLIKRFIGYLLKWHLHNHGAGLHVVTITSFTSQFS